MTYNSYFSTYLQSIENALQSSLPKPDSRINEAICYSVLNGGKRLRPLLVLLTAEIFSLDIDDIMPIAIAIEYIHAYSLVHDDLPAMDNDDLRRGKPTCHIRYDEATAILVGDALQTLAFDEIIKTKTTDFFRVKLINMLSNAIGLKGMLGGQARDIATKGLIPTLADIELTHQLKTGALLSSCVDMICLLNEERDPQLENALKNYIRSLGLAFQIQDDVLDITSTTEQLGKTQGKDSAQAQPTYVSLSSLDIATEKLYSLYDHAMSTLQPFEKRTQKLIVLADHLIQRHQ